MIKPRDVKFILSVSLAFIIVFLLFYFKMNSPLNIALLNACGGAAGMGLGLWLFQRFSGDDDNHPGLDD